MADTIESLRAEMETLRSQLKDMASKAEDKQQEIVAKVSERVGKEWAHYRDMAKEHGGHMLEAGEAGLDEVAAQIRRYPLASLGVAFAVGFVLSCLWRHSR